MIHDTYCILIITKHAFSGKSDITIDLGQQGNSTEYSDTLKGYTSEVDALNYMSSQGWSLVSSYANQVLTETRYVYEEIKKCNSISSRFTAPL